MRKCHHCNAETDLFFCPSCGEIIEYPNFIKGNQRQEKALTDFIISLVQFAKEKKVRIAELVSKGVLSEAIYRRYFERVLLLQEICSKDTVRDIFDKSGESLINVMRLFAEKCKLNECQIAIAGTVKAGKSMFLNAILGKEIASTYPTPETASLTKFRYSSSGDYVKVTYYTTYEWDVLWKSVMEASANSVRDDKEDFMSEYSRLNADSIKENLLNRKDDCFVPQNFGELKSLVSKYTSSQFAEHFFAKEVEVGLSSFHVPKNVVFVDTPGLNDPVRFRSDITRRYLHSANVVLLCVKAASADITASELEDIAILFSELRYSKERIYLFGTQYDTPTHFSDYWTEHTKPEFVKYLSGKLYFGSKECASQRIIPVTAWYYNMIQRAQNDNSVWGDTKDVEVIYEILNRCLGISTVQKYLRKYDENHMNEGLKECLMSSISELEEKTNVPNIVKLIMSGPICDAEEIILQDIKDGYIEICKDLSEISSSTLSLKVDVIKDRNNKDNKEELANIEKDIERREQSVGKIRDAIKEITKSQESIMNEVINDVKNK